MVYSAFQYRRWSCWEDAQKNGDGKSQNDVILVSWGWLPEWKPKIFRPTTKRKIRLAGSLKKAESWYESCTLGLEGSIEIHWKWSLQIINIFRYQTPQKTQTSTEAKQVPSSVAGGFTYNILFMKVGIPPAPTWKRWDSGRYICTLRKCQHSWWEWTKLHSSCQIHSTWRVWTVPLTQKGGKLPTNMWH